MQGWQIAVTEGRGFEPLVQFYPYTRFPSVHLQPLGHPSNINIYIIYMYYQINTNIISVKTICNNQISILLNFFSSEEIVNKYTNKFSQITKMSKNTRPDNIKKLNLFTNKPEYFIKKLEFISNIYFV